MKGNKGENSTHYLWTTSPHLFHSRMDKEGQKPKTFISTFRLVLKPQVNSFFVGRQKNDGLETKNSKVEVSPSTGKDGRLT